MSHMSKQHTPGGFQDKLEEALKGTQTAWPAGVDQVKVNKASYSKADVEAKLSKYITAYQNVVDTKVEHQNAIVDRAAIAGEAHEFLSNFLKAIAQCLGTDSADMTKFGGQPKKAPAQPSAETKAAAVVKRGAPRAARHTRGPKQKKDIHGEVPASPTNHAAGAAPAPATAAAPAAPTKPGA
jgi:hypothetical protein